MSGSDVRSLWGQDFKIVREGLAEEQIVTFVNDVVRERDRLLHRQQNLDHLQRLAETTVTEASELAGMIKQEAQTEAASVLEEAKARACEVTDEAQRQSGKMVTEANKLAEGAKQKAQSEATKVTQEANNRASEVAGKARREAENTVTEASERAENIKQKAEVEATKMVEDAKAKALETTIEMLGQAEIEAQQTADTILQNARQEAAVVMELASERISNEIQTVRERFVSELGSSIEELRATRGEEAQAESDGLARNESDTSPSSLPFLQASVNGEKVHNEVETSQEHAVATMGAVVTQTQEETAVASSSLESATLPLPLEDSTLFHGEVEIAVVPPVDTLQLTRLTRKLDDVSHLRILKTDGYWDEGYIITVFIDGPLPVIGFLKGIAEVAKAHLWTDGRKGSDGYFPGWIALTRTSGGLKGNRVVIKLREDLKLSTK